MAVDNMYGWSITGKRIGCWKRLVYRVCVHYNLFEGGYSYSREIMLLVGARTKFPSHSLAAYASSLIPSPVKVPSSSTASFVLNLLHCSYVASKSLLNRFGQHKSADKNKMSTWPFYYRAASRHMRESCPLNIGTQTSSHIVRYIGSGHLTQSPTLVLFPSTLYNIGQSNLSI